MNIYPIGIPTLCRYEHFKRCVESLKKNTHADKTELVVSLDYPPSEKYRKGYEMISKYVESLDGFGKVTILRHKKNLGAISNWKFLMNYLFSISDAIIMSEDDNEFSPCFLDYMNKALNKYKDNQKVYWVTGYSHPYMEHITTEKIIFKHGVCAFGIGLWREKEYIYLQKDEEYFKGEITNPRRLWNVLKRYPLGIPGEISMLYNKSDYSDIRKGIFCRTEDVYQVWPRISMVRNWGYDGSGEHCGNNPEFALQRIDKSDVFEWQELPIQENPKELKFDGWLKFLPRKMFIMKQLVKMPLYIIGFNLYSLFQQIKCHS